MASPTKKLRYVLEDFESVGPPLGGGSYGKVTKVVHKKTSEVFAMKVIPKQKVVEHQMEDYLAREVKTQLRLQHPNILRLLYYFEDPEDVHLLLEFASGGSLFGVLKRKGRLPEQDAAKYFTDVAMALDHLHNKGVVHRDLKPENILMCEGDVAKLADFGWCAELDKGGAPRRTFCGTWDYLSPEMVNNEPHDHCVDVWAIGVLLFEMLTSRSPFAATNQVKALMRITNIDLQIPDYVSESASDLLRKLLVKEPQDRLPLAESVEHAWVKLFVPEVSMRLAESAAKNAAAVERAAAAALEASLSVSQSDIEVVVPPPLPPPPPQAEVAEAPAERHPAPEEGTVESAAKVNLLGGLEDVSPAAATHGGSVGSIEDSVEAMPVVPDEPLVPQPSPLDAESLVQTGQSLSTMPWERPPPQDDKALDLATPRTQLVTTNSSLSSFSQSQATLEIPGRQGSPTGIPNATAALLQALRDPSSPRIMPSGTSRAGISHQEGLPEATANFLGALRGGSIAGRLQETLGPMPVTLAREVSDGLSSPSSHASSSMEGSRYQERVAKKVAMRGLRDKIAQRRAQLEMERSALEQQQQELEQQEQELEQQQARAYFSESPRQAGPARSRLAGVVGIQSEHESSPHHNTSPMVKVCQHAAMDLNSPRKTGSSEGSAYTELRSWVRRKTDGLRKEHTLGIVSDGLGTPSPDGTPTAGVRAKAAHHRAGVGSDYAKLSKPSKWAGDDIDSTMSSVSSELSKDSRSETRSRQRPGRMGCTIPESLSFCS